MRRREELPSNLSHLAAGVHFSGAISLTDPRLRAGGLFRQKRRALRRLALALDHKSRAMLSALAGPRRIASAIRPNGRVRRVVGAVLDDFAIVELAEHAQLQLGSNLGQIGADIADADLFAEGDGISAGCQPSDFFIAGIKRLAAPGIGATSDMADGAMGASSGAWNATAASDRPREGVTGRYWYPPP